MAIKRSMTIEDYKLLDDAYYGEGGFADGEYITPHRREDTDGNNSKYAIRKQLSYYENYIQPVVDSHVNAVYSSEPEREYNDHPGMYYELFIKDADGCGNGLNRVMKDDATKAKYKGCCLIVVDNYSNLPEDIATAQETRAFPYIFHVQPELIILDECLFDKRKNMIQVAYFESDYVDEAGKVKKQKRVWTTTESNLFREVTDSNNKITWILIQEESYMHSLGMLPCFFFYGSSNLDSHKMPTSLFYHPAKIAKAIFNICSEIREAQRNQTFAILTMPGDEKADGLTLGTNNILYFGDGTTTPAFIAPPDGPVKILMEYVKDLVNEIYRMSCVSYTQQYASSQQSGESKRWTFHITRQVLEDFAVNCEEAERKIAKIFGKYIKHDLKLEVKYSRKYGADDIDADIERTDVVMKMELPDTVKIEVIKKFVRSYFAESEDEVIQNMLKKVDEYLTELEADKQEEPDDTDIIQDGDPVDE